MRLRALRQTLAILRTGPRAWRRMLASARSAGRKRRPWKPSHPDIAVQRAGSLERGAREAAELVTPAVHALWPLAGPLRAMPGMPLSRYTSASLGAIHDSSQVDQLQEINICQDPSALCHCGRVPAAARMGFLNAPPCWTGHASYVPYRAGQRI